MNIDRRKDMRKKRPYTRSGSNLGFTAAKKRFQKGERKKFPLFLLIVLVIVAGLIAVGVVLLYPYIEEKLATGEEPKEQITEDISAAGFDFLINEENRNILHIKPPFTVNLAGLDGRWVMQATIWFEVDNIDVARELNDNPAKFYRMTDDIVRTLKSWTYAEINFGNGMDRLKMQLRDHMNGYIENGKVVKVIFNDVIFTEILPRARPVS